MIRLLMISAIALAVFSCVYGENDVTTEKQSATQKADVSVMLNGAKEATDK